MRAQANCSALPSSITSSPSGPTGSVALLCGLRDSSSSSPGMIRRRSSPSAPRGTTIGEWSTPLGLKAAGAFPPFPASHLSVTLLLASAPPAAALASSRPCRRTSLANAAACAPASWYRRAGRLRPPALAPQLKRDPLGGCQIPFTETPLHADDI